MSVVARFESTSFFFGHVLASINFEFRLSINFFGDFLDFFNGIFDFSLVLRVTDFWGDLFEFFIWQALDNLELVDSDLTKLFSWASGDLDVHFMDGVTWINIGAELHSNLQLALPSLNFLLEPYGVKVNRCVLCLNAEFFFLRPSLVHLDHSIEGLPWGHFVEFRLRV